MTSIVSGENTVLVAVLPSGACSGAYGVTLSTTLPPTTAPAAVLTLSNAGQSAVQTTVTDPVAGILSLTQLGTGGVPVDALVWVGVPSTTAALYQLQYNSRQTTPAPAENFLFTVAPFLTDVGVDMSPALYPGLTGWLLPAGGTVASTSTVLAPNTTVFGTTATLAAEALLGAAIPIRWSFRTGFPGCIASPMGACPLRCQGMS